jgi:hypothetical protein
MSHAIRTAFVVYMRNDLTTSQRVKNSVGVIVLSSTDWHNTLLFWHLGEEKTNLVRLRRMGLRNCKVSCRDLSGIEHTVEVSADSLYEAVAQALRAFRESDWVGDLAGGQFTISVIVKNPEIEHRVRVQDFERWLDSQGRTPADASTKSRLRELLGRKKLPKSH